MSLPQKAVVPSCAAFIILGATLFCALAPLSIAQGNAGVVLSASSTSPEESDTASGSLDTLSRADATGSEQLADTQSFVRCGNFSQALRLPACEERPPEGKDRSPWWLVLLSSLSSLLVGLAWPIAAVVIAKLFQKELSALLSRLKRFKAGSAEAEFEREVDEVAGDAIIDGVTQPAPESNSVRELLIQDPRGAILTAWLEVERALFVLADARNVRTVSSTGRRNAVALVRQLAKQQVIDPGLLSLFEDLRMLRNSAAHNLDFSPESDAVVHYARLASSLAKAFTDAASGDAK